MSWWPLLCALAVCILASTADERTAHRLVGGHLRTRSDPSDDTELLTALSSGSKNKKSQKNDDEEKKTLSQQVADGKYALIQKEIFAKPSKRPGVISYDNNPEVPKDNINNLGGLTKNEIWLAENHLLVLKGGSYPPHTNKDNTATAWPAIDDYKAPRRQAKIPAHPKVPPPFPVQLTDDGPLQILGTNSSRTLNGTFEQTAYALPPPQGYEPGTGPFFPPLYPYPANATSGHDPQSIPPYPPGEYQPGSPFPPFNLNGTLPPFFASLPPGAAILPPPNQTEPFDEDDPSIYYPPPYSFYYPKDNSSAVAAGPLVPGIILPPPPNFFGPLEEPTAKPTRKPGRVRTTTTPLPQIHPTTSPVPPTMRKPVRVLPVQVPSEINNELKPTVTTTPPKIMTIVPVRQPNRTVPPRTQKTRPPTVTILKPVKPSSAPPKLYVYDNEVTRQPVNVYSNRPTRVKTVISTTQVPLKVYYSTANDIETNSITQPPNNYRIRGPKTTTKSPAKYYYYEEQPQEVTTRKPFFDIPKEYYLPAKPTNPPPLPRPQKFIYVTSRPYNTQRPHYRFVQTPKTDSFSIHIARLQKQIHQYYTTTRPVYRNSPKPVYQFSFEAANYRPPQLEDPQDKFRPLPKYSVQIQPAIEIIPTEAPPPQPNYYRTSTERPAPSQYYDSPSRPDYDYEEEVKPDQPTPRPVSQYAYEATPNPIYQGFYTKPDEGFFDENTKQYFSTFGKKIPSPTTPMTPTQRQRQNRPISLEGDTDVNYLPPRPTIDPDAEFVPINPNRQRINYPQVVNYPQRPAQYAQETQQENGRPNNYPQRPAQYAQETQQENGRPNNYPPRPAQYAQETQQENGRPNNYPSRPAQYAQEPQQENRGPVNIPTSEGQPGSFISYQLPGDDGAHFYFLTPQLAQSRDQGAGYYYSQPRIRRNKER